MANHTGENRFEIVQSELMTQLAAEYQIAFDPDLRNLQALASTLGATLPDEPRVLLVSKGEYPDFETYEALVSDDVTLAGFVSLRSTDIMAHLPDTYLSDRDITFSIAEALARKRRLEQTTTQRAWGMRLVLGGMAVTVGGGAGLQSNVIGGLGLLTFAAGAGLAAYASNRSPVTLADSYRDMPPPVRSYSIADDADS